jgi:hypothetical protein
VKLHERVLCPDIVLPTLAVLIVLLMLLVGYCRNP